MKRFLLLASLLAFVVAAHAAPPKFNCTTACLFVADTYPSSGPVPTSCKLYSSGALKASATAVAVSGGVQCQIRTTFAVGTYSVTMTAIDGAGQETAQSVPFAFESAVPLAVPANVRIQ